MLNTGPGQVVQGLASYQEMCDVYLVYWVQVQTCLFISTDIYTSKSTYLNYQYICRVTTPSCCRGRPPAPTRALPPPGPTWASVTYQTRMDSNSRHQEKNIQYHRKYIYYVYCLFYSFFLISIALLFLTSF